MVSTMAAKLLTLMLLLAASAGADGDAGDAGPGGGVRAIAEVMSQPPLVAIENSLRAWAIEKSEDFGVVLVEVLGQVPLHMHPDGNRRMFLVEGRVRMQGGSHEMDMRPGDYMYLPRDHHHKVWLAPGTERALLILVDNPPTSARNVVWLDPTPEVRMNQKQAESALRFDDRCEAAPVKTAR
jgi:mannose-6-phosphate isomerase-like protein (cupin superfamily)